MEAPIFKNYNHSAICFKSSYMLTLNHCANLLSVLKEHMGPGTGPCATLLSGIFIEDLGLNCRVKLEFLCRHSPMLV